MSTVTFTRQDIYSGSLRLVRKEHPIQDCEVREPLTKLGRTQAGEVVMMGRAAARMMRCLLGSGSCDGKLQLVSGYRSRREQHRIFEETRQERGEAFTRRFVALPGCSEHETGLAIDLAGAAAQADLITPDFPEEGSFARFRDFCSLYGFVERYPEGKSEITGIGFEPWHFRYVGRPHARIMVQNGWTLEEYIEELARHTSFDSALVHQGKNYTLRVFTLRPGRGGEVALHLPQGTVWQASGNNVDGVVVSAWN